MRNRTMMAAAGAVTAALAAGSISAAVASTTGATPAARHKAVSAGAKRADDGDLAARLGVSPARLDQALRTVKISLIRAHAQPSQRQFDAALARILGIPQARVRQAFPVGKRGSKAIGAEAPVRASENALTAAVARELHVSTTRVSKALRPLFAAGRADPSSPSFAAAARSLGVSIQQLTAALVHAKQSLAGGK
jgi:hypothetical protein